MAAELKRVSGDEDGCRKLLECAATIKDIWIDAHREMVDAMGGTDKVQVVGWPEKETMNDYKAFLRKKEEIFY